MILSPRGTSMKWSALAAAIAASAVLGQIGSPAARAATGTWTGATDNTWANSNNWTASPPPGSGDTATFSSSAASVNNNTTIDLGAGQTVSSLVFDTTGAAAYTIGAGGAGAQTLTITDLGPGGTGNPSITMGLAAASAPTVNEIINANLLLGDAAVSTTTITNNATAASGLSLTVNGTVQGGTGGTAGAKTVNTAGTGAVNFTNAFTPGGASSISLANTGTGTTTLSGNVASTFSTLRASGSGGVMIVNGQTVTVTLSSQYGTGSLSSKFVLQSGSVSFNGGIQSSTSSGQLAGADGLGVIVNGGTFSASTVALGRSFNFSTTSGASVSTAQNMGTSGFQVNAGTANVTGAVNLAGSNSAASGQVSGTGSLTVGGELTVGGQGSGGTTRTTLLQVTGGTLTDTDTVGNGIVIGRGNTTAASGELLLTGGTTTTEKVTFGLSGGLAGSFGYLTVNGASANLYVGGGGIGLAATNAFTSAINLNNGTLGAKADWSSAMNMNLNGSAGTPFTFQAADAANTAHNITLNGVLGGAGSFNKTGGGVLTLTGGATGNTYSGGTTLTAGTLNINGIYALGGGNFGGLNMAGGTLQFASGTTGGSYGGADISFGAPSSKFVTISGNTAMDANGNAVTFANAIGNGGAGGLTLTDSASGGSFTFNGAGNNYSGPTAVNNTTLAVNGTLTNSAVSVNSAGRLNGTGTISQAVSVSGTVGAATAGTIGTLSFGNGLSLNSGATYNADFNDTTSDLLAITGGLSLTNDTLNLNQLATPTASSYTLATFTGSLLGTFTTVNNLPTGYVVDYNASSITLDKSAPVPEPASLGLLALGGASLLVRRRRR